MISVSGSQEIKRGCRGGVWCRHRPNFLPVSGPYPLQAIAGSDSCLSALAKIRADASSVSGLRSASWRPCSRPIPTASGEPSVESIPCELKETSRSPFHSLRVPLIGVTADGCEVRHIG
jgi:hypothetical protein